MTDSYRLIRSSRTWVRIVWREGQRHDRKLAKMFRELQPIPGIQLNPCSIEFPITTWMLDVVAEVFAEVGFELPQLHLHAPSRQGQAPGQEDYGVAPLWFPMRELYQHQRQAVSCLAGVDGALLCDDMGLGKTSSAIVAAKRHADVWRDGAHPCVIVAPLFTRGTWLDELLALGAIDDPLQFCALEGRDIDGPSWRTPSEGVRWYFVHYDVARAWWSRINRFQPAATIVDECHCASSSKTQRGKAAMMLTGPVSKRILLTGTPLDNRPGDLWWPLSMATGTRTWGGPLDFRKRYAGAQRNDFGWQDTEPTHVEEFWQRLQPFYIRRTAEQVGLNLPELVRVSQLCELGAFKREHDDVLGDNLATVVRAVASGRVRDVLRILGRLRQITSRAKLPATVEYVSNAQVQGESVVVFCWEREIAHSLAGRFGDSLLVTGELSQDKRDAQVRRFQQDGGVLIATIDSLREGVTLHRARVVVMHDLDWRLAPLLQAEKRIHRIGQKRACVSVWMLAKDSIDTLLAPVLVRKAELQAELLKLPEGMSALEDVDLGQIVGRESVEEQVDRALRVWSAR